MKFDHESHGSDSLERVKSRLKRQIVYLSLLFVAVVVAQRYIDRLVFGGSSAPSTDTGKLDHEVSVEAESGDTVSTLP